MISASEAHALALAIRTAGYQARHILSRQGHDCVEITLGYGAGTVRIHAPVEPERVIKRLRQMSERVL